MKIEFETGDFVDNLKRKAWEVKHDAEIKVNETINWGMQNKEFVVLAAPVALKAVKGVYKLLSKSKQQKLMELQDSRFWDPRAGKHVYPRRKLSKCEEEEAMRLYRSNKDLTYVDILRDMNA